jgi:hypothetical protein
MYLVAERYTSSTYQLKMRRLRVFSCLMRLFTVGEKR